MFPALAAASSPSVTPEAATKVGIDTATLNSSVNPNGQETSYRFEYGTTTSYGKSVPVPDKAIGSGKEAVKVSETIGGLTSGTTYHFRVVAANVEGTSFGADKSLTTEVDSRFAFAFGSAGSGDGQFFGSEDIAIDSSGNVWVSDEYFNNRVEEFNSKGEYLSKFGTKGSGNGQFELPIDIAIDPSGNLWVTDEETNRVEKFNSKGEYLSKFGSLGSGNGQFTWPFGIAIDSENNVWVADTFNARVEEFNSKGEYLSKFGTTGSGNGQFETPHYIAIDSGGALWVTDSQGRVEHFNAKGEYLSQFGTKGNGQGQFNGPGGLAVDSEDNVWVVDSGNNRVQKWVP